MLRANHKDTWCNCTTSLAAGQLTTFFSMQCIGNNLLCAITPNRWVLLPTTRHFLRNAEQLRNRQADAAPNSGEKLNEQQETKKKTPKCATPCQSAPTRFWLSVWILNSSWHQHGSAAQQTNPARRSRRHRGWVNTLSNGCSLTKDLFVAAFLALGGGVFPNSFALADEQPTFLQLRMVFAA